MVMFSHAQLSHAKIRQFLGSRLVHSVSLALLAGVLPSLLAERASSQTATTLPAATLRICASENEAPYSAREGKGFENRIAVVLAETMGRRPEIVWTSKPAIYLVRDYLDQNKCDVVMGLDTGDERVLTSKPYYRTGYAFVTLAERNVTASAWNDDQIRGLSRFAIRFYSPPAESILRQLDKYEDNVSYLHSLVNFKSRRNQYVQVPAERLVSEVTSGEADIAIAFAPEVARYVKASSKPLRMTLLASEITRSDGLKIPVQYDQSVGVRKGDAQLLAEIDAALVKARPQIQQLLRAEGIPLLETHM
jgi:mxaJ protein